MSEQLASWVPSLYRKATSTDVQEGRLASLTENAGGEAPERRLVMRSGSGRYILLIAFILEHVVCLAALVLVCMIPKTPEWVANEIARLEFYKEKHSKAFCVQSPFVDQDAELNGQHESNYLHPSFLKSST